MPEMSTILIIGGISLLVFGGGAAAAFRVLTGRKKGGDSNTRTP